ncbi:nucleic acid-binding protein [Pseudovirgaria hyperparasitica]|uniref:Nucleic acid-binding protein n=1 Tax=Pseudovirgaria hyperparasitica TaxID=470096 RepID=A0A6A6VV97_9PEZI|nr:nucleic acid-binding protein [Pseudovirgaria hyperparasitica]KAF2754608.1 nucleic acid-binding protein [Pseudovirgaria hyperparasitica]
MAERTIDELTSLLKQSTLSSRVPNETDPVKLSSAVFPEASYTDAEKDEISQWVISSSHLSSTTEDAAKKTERLSQLNTHFAARTTLLGSKPSVADIAVYQGLAPQVQVWTDEERTGEHGYHHIVRFVDFVQNSSIYGLQLDVAKKISIDPDNVKFAIKPVDMKAEKERKKKEKEAAAAAAKGAVDAGATPTSLSGQASDPTGQGKKEKAKGKVEQLGDAVAAAVGKETPTSKKKEKKEKAPKAKAPPPAEKPLSPCLIDLRVGHILKAERHPNADSLYVSTIACGDAPGTDNTSEYEGQTVRTVCSGLNGLIPLEEMQNRKIVAVCNLKPVTMRGIKSCAMVLAASPKVPEGGDSHAGPVELVNPPAESKAGERVFFEGWEGEPEPVLNPKKKIWETIQPGFTTTVTKEVGFEVGDVPQLSGEGEAKKSGLAKLKTAQGLCTVPTLEGATVR